jgi:hypothetical protein
MLDDDELSEVTDDPVIVDVRYYYKVELWTRDCATRAVTPSLTRATTRGAFRTGSATSLSSTRRATRN